MDENIHIIIVCLVVLNIYLVYRTRCIKDEVIAEKFSNDDLLTIRDEINKQYNIDVESIRNLGAISKSLLTGTNYHSTDVGTPGQLTIPADTTLLQGQLKINSTADLSGPSAETRITSQGIIFGGPNNGRETNSAQISVGKLIQDSLCIVGMSPGTDWKTRRIEMWAEGGLQINGSTTISGAVNTGDSVNINTSGAVGGGFQITNHSKTSQGKTWKIYNMNNAEGYKNALEFWSYPRGDRQLVLNDDGTSSFNGPLSTAGAVTTGGQILVNGSDDLGGPGPETRITSQGIIFGGANNGREGSSAQISAGKHRADSLCIVGMSNTNKQNYKIDMWADGGLQINGPTTISGAVNTGDSVNINTSGAVGGGFQITNHSKTSQGKTWKIYNMNNAEGYKNALEFWSYPRGDRQFALNDDGTSDFSGAVNTGGQVTTGGQILVNGTENLSGPGPETRITSQGIIFGGANNDRENNSAQISAGKHKHDSLCIVGMSNTNKQNRKIDMWAEGGLQINGSTNISGSSTVSGDLTVNGNIRFGNRNTLLMDILPRGMVMAWALSGIPAGWVACDGKNGTPNLVGRFVLGWGGPYGNLNASGGAATHTLTEAEMPAHSHNYTAATQTNFPQGYDGGPHYQLNNQQYKNKNTNSTGGNAPHNNMPPYYVLIYIMKT